MVRFSFVLLTSVVSIYMVLTYFYHHSNISIGSDVPSGQEVAYNNIFAIVHKQNSESTVQDGQILRCSQITYGGNILAGLNDVTTLQFTPKGQFIPTQESRPCDKGIVSTDLELNIREYRHGLKCVKNFQEEYLISKNAIWAGDTHLIRQNHHSYLTRNSIVVEIGGNLGEDASAILRKYKPNAYVLLEPIRPLYNQLMGTFKKTRNMHIYNFGLGKKLSYFHVNMEGHKGETTSTFTGSNSGDCLIKVINATKFMLKLGVGCFDVDLLTINCEGCEFDVLESLISSSLIEHFKHVQFATHPTLEHLTSPVTRYCEIIQILSRTHVPSYRYGFVWESWTRRDIIQKNINPSNSS
ncbi:uncharacterized protein LOC110455331 [Mizuhopecten yessoensis]|uniref:Methyltransferase FkbM domain-containing protein n=1 Tax=Mizuhopecten yessoensis TaxID=6573 RepID=A0A210QDB7_MIZYE|nr:uncharacterized protein LOC110455331 [Mizuhopecten yessoensis]OWF46734.1 hypothetical protein KP79_PYT21230 [Mizuhopecten yessoensis]